jgi:hypothetical protein
VILAPRPIGKRLARGAEHLEPAPVHRGERILALHQGDSPWGARS